MSLALTLFYTFQVLAVAGLKTLIIREVAKDKTKTAQYFVNGSVVVVASSLFAVIAMLLFVWVMGYSRDTAAIILLLSLGLLPYSLSAICEAVFQAWERMHYIAYANVPANILKISLAFLMLSQGYSVYHLIALIVASHVIIVCTEWFLMFQYITRPHATVDPHFSLAMTRTTVTFLGIDVAIAIWASLQVVLLSKLTTETDVGLFSAAAQLMVPVTLVFQSIVVSIFPTMCRRFEPSFHGLRRVANHLIAVLLVIALPTAVGLFFLADSALLLLYGGRDFLLASTVLRIMVWLLILTALTSALGQVLLASLKEKITLRIVTVNALISLILGLILISQFGLIGAAIATLLTAVINFVQHYLPVSKLLSNIALGRLAWKPIVACLGMAAYLSLVTEQEIFLTILSAATVYTVIFLALELWSAGGPRQLKAKYQTLFD
jgi:O-antigen/teichoic acid export membrane protein